jgi:pyridoxamine 5'-phosphate oxidase
MDISLINQASEAPEDPFELFSSWYQQAEKSEPCDHNAMSVATCGLDGKPSVRILLLKDVSPAGFIFYTNLESRKGRQLKENNFAALCFYWKSLGFQVRVEGKTTILDDSVADEYYATRPKGSRLGAWASKQSSPLNSRQDLEERIEKLEVEYAASEQIPRPSYWSGYCLEPERIEFWKQGQYRVHTRVLYTKSKDSWERILLNP